MTHILFAILLAAPAGVGGAPHLRKRTLLPKLKNQAFFRQHTLLWRGPTWVKNAPELQVNCYAFDSLRQSRSLWAKCWVEYRRGKRWTGKARSICFNVYGGCHKTVDKTFRWRVCLRIPTTRGYAVIKLMNRDVSRRAMMIDNLAVRKNGFTSSRVIGPVPKSCSVYWFGQEDWAKEVPLRSS